MKENDASTEKTSNHNRYTLLFSFLRTTLLPIADVAHASSARGSGLGGEGALCPFARTNRSEPNKNTVNEERRGKHTEGSIVVPLAVFSKDGHESVLAGFPFESAHFP